MTIFMHFRYQIRVVALLSVVFAVSTVGAPVWGQEMDPKQFREIAAELVQGLNDTHLGRISSSAGYNAPKVALRSLTNNKQLSKHEAELINSHLMANLQRLGGKGFHFINRSNIKALVDERDRYGATASKADALNILLENSQADILIIGQVSKNEGRISLSYQAVASHSGQVLVSTAPRIIVLLNGENTLQVTAHRSGIPNVSRPGSSGYKAKIEQAEIRLFELGYEPGVADGYLTNETRSALRNYQSDSALRVNGRLTRQTFNNMFLDTRLAN